jgi:hypothetical protein
LQSYLAVKWLYPSIYINNSVQYAVNDPQSEMAEGPFFKSDSFLPPPFLCVWATIPLILYEIIGEHPSPYGFLTAQRGTKRCFPQKTDDSPLKSTKSPF